MKHSKRLSSHSSACLSSHKQENTGYWQYKPSSDMFSRLTISTKCCFLRTGLTATQATASTLVRTGKIGLNSFLSKANVPGNESPTCECGGRWEDAKYVIIFCPRWRVGSSKMLHDKETNDFLTLISTNKGLRAMTMTYCGQYPGPIFARQAAGTPNQ